MQEEKQLHLLIWIGYVVGDFRGQLSRKQRKLLRDLVARPDWSVQGENEVHDVEVVSNHAGRRLGYGVVLGEHYGSIDLSTTQRFSDAWLDELGRPLQDMFDTENQPCVYLSIGRDR